jgi:hypothetical protein
MDKIHGLELGRLEVRKTCSLFMRRPRGDLEAGAVVGRELLEAPLVFRTGSEAASWRGSEERLFFVFF